MKKTYLAPMSETLSAILKDMCGADGDPVTPGATSGSGTTEADMGRAPHVPHGL